MSQSSSSSPRLRYDEAVDFSRKISIAGEDMPFVVMANLFIESQSEVEWNELLALAHHHDHL